MVALAPEGWNEFLTRYPNAHMPRPSAWGELNHPSVEAARVVQDDCGAQVLFRRLPLGRASPISPKDPWTASGWGQLWDSVDPLCWENRAIHLIVEPDVCRIRVLSTILRQQGSVRSQAIQPPHHRVDLSGVKQISWHG
jgi:hypothetical protein